MLAIAAVVAALLSIPQVAALFEERATLDQSYDVGRYGRFGRYVLGAQLSLDHPFGIGLAVLAIFRRGPAQYLSQLLYGGRLARRVLLRHTLSAVTVMLGLRFVPVRTSWQPTYLAVYAAYLGVLVESAIIDIDHWRHFFLMLGALWGLMAATRARAWSRHGAALAAGRGDV
jgi:hypothetical protein